MSDSRSNILPFTLTSNVSYFSKYENKTRHISEHLGDVKIVSTDRNKTILVF